MKGRLGAAGSKMIAKCKELLEKYREIIVYLIVGVLNTIVSWVAYFICIWTFLNPDISWQHFVANTISWVVGVLFSYPLNRRWVFKSTNPKIIKEFGGFAGSRILTWFMDVVIMWATVNVWKMPEWIAKVFISSVLVTITNYVFSKLFIFRKKKPEEKED